MRTETPSCMRYPILKRNLLLNLWNQEIRQHVAIYLLVLAHRVSPVDGDFSRKYYFWKKRGYKMTPLCCFSWMKRNLLNNKDLLLPRCAYSFALLKSDAFHPSQNILQPTVINIHSCKSSQRKCYPNFYIVLYQFQVLHLLWVWILCIT